MLKPGAGPAEGTADPRQADHPEERVDVDPKWAAAPDNGFATFRRSLRCCLSRKREERILEGKKLDAEDEIRLAFLG